MTATVRTLLEQYVRTGTLMQLATLRPGGSPVVCNVWYDAHFAPDVLRFVSRHGRHHSVNIRDDPRVAGSIVAIDLEGLGQKARGVTFTGAARELDPSRAGAEIAAFTRRWPAASAALEPGTPHRLYEVTVDEWVLFDEVNFPEQPRQVVDGTRYASRSTT